MVKRLAARRDAADGPGPGTVELGKFAGRQLAQVVGRWIEERMTVWDKVEVGRHAEKPYGARSLAVSGLAERSLAEGSLASCRFAEGKPEGGRPSVRRPAPAGRLAVRLLSVGDSRVPS